MPNIIYCTNTIDLNEVNIDILMQCIPGGIRLLPALQACCSSIHTIILYVNEGVYMTLFPWTCKYFFSDLLNLYAFLTLIFSVACYVCLTWCWHKGGEYQNHCRARHVYCNPPPSQCSCKAHTARPRNIHTVYLCFHVLSRQYHSWTQMLQSPMFPRPASLAIGQFQDCPSAR